MALDLLGKHLDYTGVEQYNRGLLGGLLRADWREALVARGFGWHVDVGAFSTPIVGGGNGTVLDQDQPEFVISVPSGYCAIPLRFVVACQVPLVNADSDECEILIAVDRLTVAAGLPGNGTEETPINMRTNSVSGCPATVYSAMTGNITNPTLGMELEHEVIVADLQGIATNAHWGRLKLVHEPARPNFLIGPCAIYGYWGGTVATSGFGNLEFLVIASNLVTGLS